MLNYLRGVHEELLAGAGRGVSKCATEAAPPASQQDPCSGVSCLPLQAVSNGWGEWGGVMPKAT